MKILKKSSKRIIRCQPQSFILTYFSLFYFFQTVIAADNASREINIGWHRKNCDNTAKLSNATKQSIRTSTHGVVIEMNSSEGRKSFILRKSGNYMNMVGGNFYSIRAIAKIEVSEKDRQHNSILVKFNKELFARFDEPTKYVINSELKSLLTEKTYEKLKI